MSLLKSFVTNPMQRRWLATLRGKAPKIAVQEVYEPIFEDPKKVLSRNFATIAPGKPMGGHAFHFKIERYFAAAILPLFPAAYFAHGPVMDALLTAAVALHVHWGIVAVVNDYGRAIVIGQTAARLAVPFAYILSISLLVAVLHFNVNDVGLTRAFEMFFSL